MGTGRPIVLRDETSVRHCRILLNHQLSSPSDLRLVAQVELIAQKSESAWAPVLTYLTRFDPTAQIYETLTPLNGSVSHATLSFIRRANVALDKWWADCDLLHRETMDEDSFLRKVLIGELHYAKLWLVCVVLRGVSWDKMSFEQRELAFQAKEAASNCLATFLNSPPYRYVLCPSSPYSHFPKDICSLLFSLPFQRHIVLPSAMPFMTPSWLVLSLASSY